MPDIDIFKAATGEPDHKAIFDWLSPSLEPAAGSMGAPAWGGPDSGPSPMAQAFNLAEQNKYLQSDIYNNMLAAATPGALPMGASRDDLTGRTSALPGWTAWRSSGAGTATVVADSAYPGGHYVESKFSAIGSLTSNNVVLTTDLFPLTRGMQVSPGTIEGVNVPAAVTLNYSYSLRYYTAAGAYISTVSLASQTGGPASWSPVTFEPGAFPATPLNVRFGRFELALWETTNHDAATYDRFGGVATSQEWPIMTFTQGFNSGGSVGIDGALAVRGPVTLGRTTDGVGFYGVWGALKQTVTGSRGGNAALASLLTALANVGLITDSSTA